jgi:uncharacterized protein involved in exopolysaccharide biosynthesis
VVRRALRYWKAAVLALAVGLSGTALWVERTSNIYLSETVLLYRDMGPRGLEGEDVRRVGVRLKDMLLAHDRLLRLSHEQRIYPNISDPDEAVAELKKRIDFRAQGGNTFAVTFRGDPPAVVQGVLKRLADGLIADDTRQRANEAEVARKILDGERTRTQEEVKKREAALQAFVREHPEVTLLQPPEPATPAEIANLSSLQATLEQLRAQQRVLLAARPASDEPRTGPDPRALEALRASQVEVERARLDLADKRAKLTDEHPDVILARDKVQRAEGVLRKAAAVVDGSASGRAASGGGGPDPALAASIRDLEAKIARIQVGQTGASRARSRKAMELELQVGGMRFELNQARERLSRLEDQQVQASLRQRLESTGGTGRLQVLSPAYMPAVPESKRKQKVGLAGLAASLLLAIGAALVRAVSDDRIFDRKDAELMTGVAVLAVVPKMKLRSGRAHV